jgi:hypothetical protein
MKTFYCALTFLVSVVSFSFLSLFPHNKEEIPLSMNLYSYIIKFAFPPAVTTKGLYIYYKGKPYPFIDNNLCIITEKKCTRFTVIITQAVDSVVNKNQKKYFKRKKKIPFLWYDLDLIFDNPLDPFINCPRYHWRITPRPEYKASERIPDNAIIILLNANFIEDLTIMEIKDHCSEQEFPQAPTFCTIYFPLIKIKKDLSIAEWEKSLIKQALDLDIKTLHKTGEPHIQQVNPQHIITLPGA